MAEKNTFLNRLSESRLLTDVQLAEACGQLGGATMEAFASGLIERGMLTHYQVQQLQSGRSKGLVLGQYRILDELGRGGYGCVYKARHNLMDRVVALKVIAPELIENPQARTWFRREVLAATHLNHPNIVAAYDADEVDDILFFAMEYVDGPNLDTLVRARGPLPIGMACEMMQQTAKALQYAHEKGMVHRDIKPANLLIPVAAIAEAMGMASAAGAGAARSVLAKVVDFGLARLHHSANQSTLVLQSEKSFVGTPAYVAPEQARNVHDADIRSDLYSLGCTFYFALTGSAPFKGQTALQTIVQHLEKEPEPLEKCRPEIPPALAGIVRRLMAKKPEKRFQTPAELLSELSFFYGMERKGIELALPASGLFGRPIGLRPQVELECEEAKPADTRSQAPLTNGNEALPAPEPFQATDPEDYHSLDATCVKPELWIPPQARPEGGLKIPSGTLRLPHLASPELTIATPERTASQVAAPSACADTITFGAQESPGDPSTAKSGVVAKPKAPVLDAAWRNGWREWAQIVEALLAGQREPIAQASYRKLHQELLAACESDASAAGESKANVPVQIAEIVRPWLTLQTLAAADRDTLSSLHARCRQMNWKLGIARQSYWPWLATVFVLAVLGGLGASAISRLDRLHVVLNEGGPAATWWTFLEKHPVLSLAVAVPILVATLLFLLKRLLRS